LPRTNPRISWIVPLCRTVARGNGRFEGGENLGAWQLPVPLVGTVVHGNSPFLNQPRVTHLRRPPFPCRRYRFRMSAGHVPEARPRRLAWAISGGGAGTLEDRKQESAEPGLLTGASLRSSIAPTRCLHSTFRQHETPSTAIPPVSISESRHIRRVQISFKDAPPIRAGGTAPEITRHRFWTENNGGNLAGSSVGTLGSIGVKIPS